MGKKFLNRLGFKITNEFLKRNNFNKYGCDDSLKTIFTLIKSYCKEVLQKEWMANNVVKLPDTLNVINPISLLLKEDGYEDGIVEFCCHDSIANSELDKMVYLLSNSIEEFIEKHRIGLKEYSPATDLENIKINPQLQGAVDKQFLIGNEALVKVLFIRELANKSIFIGTSEDAKYLQEGREIRFYPSYTKQDGHILISEIIEINIAGKIERMAYFITPNIEIQDGEIYIYPLIGIKRFISDKRLNSIQFGTARNYSTLIFSGCTYHSPRISYTGAKEIKIVSEDWKLLKYIEEFKGITFEDISSYIYGDDMQNIYLVYSSKSGGTHKLGASVPGSDKLDIYNYIKANIKGLEIIEPIEELIVKQHSGRGGLTNADKIVLPNTLYRSDKTEIELLVLHPLESTLYQDVITVIEEGKLIENNIGLTKCGDALYSLETSGKKIINILVRDVTSIVGLEIKSDDETREERLSKLINDMEIKSSDKLYLALIDLENMGKYDAKAIIRKALDGCGIINQFINSKAGTNVNKVASCIRDLLNDIGLGNLNQTIGENEVVYTLHKTEKINIICRLDNKSIKIKIPGVTDSYLHVTDVYQILAMVKDRIKDIDSIDDISINTFVHDVESEKRDVIVVLENGETQYNSIFGNLNNDLWEKIKLHSKELVETDLLGHQEIIQTTNNKLRKITKGTGVYKISDGFYISIGDKGQDQTTVEASKIRTWTNKFNKISIGATIVYKDRIGYKICIHKNKDNDRICKLIHTLRLAMTTHTHLNRCITTDYISGLGKHL